MVVLLWPSAIWSRLLIQLQLIFTVLQLTNLLLYVSWEFSLTIFKKDHPTLISRFLLNGGLYQNLFLWRFLQFTVGVVRFDAEYLSSCVYPFFQELSGKMALHVERLFIVCNFVWLRVTSNTFTIILLASIIMLSSYVLKLMQSFYFNLAWRCLRGANSVVPVNLCRAFL